MPGSACVFEEPLTDLKAVRPADHTDDSDVFFGPFRLAPRRRLLIENGKRLRLGSRAFDILVALVDRAGQIVSKEELSALIWPNKVMDDANLRVHVAALRKALGDAREGSRYISSIVGRGYSFVLDVTRSEPPAEAASEPHHRLRPTLNRVIGQNAAIESISNRLRTRRLVTIVGPPGIGKTTLAVAVGETLTTFFDNEVRFVDLSSVSQARHVVTSVAAALDLSIHSENPLDDVLRCLADRRMLLFFDNCEHLIDNAASLAENIVRDASKVHVCATSREPLRVEGEWVHRMAPLPAPPEAGRLTVADAMRFPAMELFLERAVSTEDDFEILDSNVESIANICRKLEGIPLAIELVATRVDMFGVQELEKIAIDRSLNLSNLRRSAQPRHQTLYATLEWSYGILSAEEQTALRRLAIFREAFTIDAAESVIAFDMERGAVFSAVVSLAAKSLLSVDASGDEVRYRLLEMTRAFAFEKLAPTERRRLSQEHLNFFISFVKRAEADLAHMAAPDWVRAYGRCVGDVRSAIEWALSGQGDAGLGATLMAAASPLFFQLSLTEELRAGIEDALRSLGRRSADPRLELQLRNALSTAIYNLNGASEALAEATRKALELAESIGPGQHQLRPLYEAIRERYLAGDYEACMSLLERYGSLARGISDPEKLFLHSRMISLALHLSGRQSEGRHHAEQIISSANKPARTGYEKLYQYDHGVIGRCHLAKILWVQGFHDQASRVANEAFDIARSTDSKLLICSALALAVCPVSFWNHDLDLAKKSISELFECSLDNSTRYWRSWGVLFERAVSACEGRVEPALGQDQGLTIPQAEMQSTLHPSFVDSTAIARAENNPSIWNSAEVLRAAGENARATNSEAGLDKAERLFLKSLELAKAHEAKSWELRASISLANHWSGRGRRVEARTILDKSFSRFTEGHSFGDVQAARTLLAQLS